MQEIESYSVIGSYVVAFVTGVLGITIGKDPMVVIGAFVALSTLLITLVFKFLNWSTSAYFLWRDDRRKQERHDESME